MLQDWINKTKQDEVDPEEMVGELRDLVLDAPEDALPGLLAALTRDPYDMLVSVPLHLNDTTQALVELVDRLKPDPEQAEILARRFPITWAMSVWGGEALDVRVLLNGIVLVRNHHRVLGPALWEGVTLEASPDLLADLMADIETLRSRSADGFPSCFLMSRTPGGLMLLARTETADLSAPSWGQTIAVCALEGEDLDEGSPLRCEELREIGAQARSLVVFVRSFGDRVDLIPAARFDDDLDVFLEEMADVQLCDNLEEGIELDTPLTREGMIREIILRTEHETEHLPDDGAGREWLHAHAMPALASRLANTMNWSIVNFGFGPDLAGPRRQVPLPSWVSDAIGPDADLMRRSATFRITLGQEGSREMALSGGLSDQISSVFEAVSGESPALVITALVNDDSSEPAVEEKPCGADQLPDRVRTGLDRIRAQAEADEYDFEDALIESGFGLDLLVDLGPNRPSDTTIATVARDLSGLLGETVQVFLNGRGEYLAYAEGEVDSGDHELFRLEEGDGDDHDEV